MLKYFRAIRKRVLNEGKLSRYLADATGEILLVVIGILIALQVNNWNEYQKDREQEIRILHNLRMDLQRRIENLAERPFAMMNLIGKWKSVFV